ncbi:retron Ec48 family effector membrane protein [Colwellia sp. D2M02]|uniref:retron Ec48 family effector membrane protein n=1 Tax=Colwellia sp. D2M02 TaxID=2841562 RepID=UPI001C09AA31|nr:retron Ec48 family effector membrane protein [Colwellia sp. D2M02]MBU2893715.1 retron Ec48 family effector membrane protein [Colwellia sp. D2M02]
MKNPFKTQTFGRIREFIGGISWHLKAPLIFILLILFYVITLIIVEFTTDDNLVWAFCMSENCLAFINTRFTNTLSLIDWVLKVGAIWFALGSFILGIRTFDLAQKNSITNNHINNFKSFCDYINVEINNYQYLKSNKIDLYKLYDLAFPKSKEGVLSDFDGYEIKLKDCRSQLINSAKIFKKQPKGNVNNFDYEKHQAALISKLEKFGIELSHLHRNDFYFIEDDIIRFIDMVTQTFTTIADRPVLLGSINRHYR